MQPTHPSLPAGGALPPYRAAIDASWIDYNGHLRDAYYGLVLSYAVDDVMDHLGIDAAYRQRTQCTLYTLELHLHYLHEVKQSDELVVTSFVLDADVKRIHLGCRFACARLATPAAVAEVMLLHVRQGDRPGSAAFPSEVGRTLDALKLAVAARDAWIPASRKLTLKRL